MARPAFSWVLGWFVGPQGESVLGGAFVGSCWWRPRSRCVAARGCWQRERAQSDRDFHVGAVVSGHPTIPIRQWEAGGGRHTGRANVGRRDRGRRGAIDSAHRIAPVEASSVGPPMGSRGCPSNESGERACHLSESSARRRAGNRERTLPRSAESEAVAFAWQCLLPSIQRCLAQRRMLREVVNASNL